MNSEQYKGSVPSVEVVSRSGEKSMNESVASYAGDMTVLLLLDRADGVA